MIKKNNNNSVESSGQIILKQPSFLYTYFVKKVLKDTVQQIDVVCLIL